MLPLGLFLMRMQLPGLGPLNANQPGMLRLWMDARYASAKLFCGAYCNKTRGKEFMREVFDKHSGSSGSAARSNIAEVCNFCCLNNPNAPVAPV